MINLVQAPYGMEIRNMDIDTFVERTKSYVNEEFVRWMLKEEEYVEVTYNPDNKVCRFDFVNIDSIKYSNSQKTEDFDFLDLCLDVNYDFINIDVDFMQKKIKSYVILNKLEVLLEGLSEENKIGILNEYKVLRSSLKEANFYLESNDEMGTYLVTESLKGLTVNDFKNAINTIEEFKTCISKYCI